MPLVVYIGPHIDGVAVPYGLGELTAPHGVPVEVPEDLARGLLEQSSNWKPVPPPDKKAAAKAATREEDEE